MRWFKKLDWVQWLALGGLILFHVVIVCIVAKIVSEAENALAVFGGCLCFLFPVILVDIQGISTMPRSVDKRRLLVANESANAITPDRYYRLIKRGWDWRRIVLVIDEAIDIPNAEIIPVQVVHSDGGFTPRKGEWVGVWFEYKNSVYCGHMRV